MLGPLCSAAPGLILQQANVGLFIWQKQRSSSKREYTGPWRASPRNVVSSLWRLMAKVCSEASPDSRDGAINPISWWEEWYIILQRVCI